MIERCWLCGNEADVFQVDEGFYVIGCDDDADCVNNVCTSYNWFTSEDEAIEWWNKQAEEVYKKCPKGDKL